MKKIERSEILETDEYVRIRDEFRQRIMQVKNHRRLIVGDYLCFLFENRDTMIYQVQEMMRAEGIRDEQAIQHEIATYNELVPAPHELAATLLIEFADELVRRVKLKELVGLHEHIHLIIDGDYMIKALFDDRQMDPDKISSVQYIRFPLGPEATEAFLSAKNVELLTDHPACSYRQPLTPEQLAALQADLRQA